MNKLTCEAQSRDTDERQPAQWVDAVEKSAWETPRIEDVSEQVMAQPYIRFT